MRFPNYLSPSSNRASLSITQTLYDRRALDCTSSRPLVQSLQQLIILTGSSSRVRETLCHDGGLERIVQIMKDSAPASEDPMVAVKWHLCMQCLLNLGARGSENVRMRIVEAGAIPLIVTILDNYLVANSDSLEHRDRDREVRCARQQSSSSSSLLVGSNARSIPSLETNALGLAAGFGGRGDTPIYDLESQGASNGETSGDDASTHRGEHRAEHRSTVSAAEGAATRLASEIASAAAAASQNELSQEPYAPQFGTLTGQPTEQPTQQSGEQSEPSAFESHLLRQLEIQNPQPLQAHERFVESPLSLFVNTLPSRRAVEFDQTGMAQFVDGIVIPKEQDVFWALEIVAFVSKYSHLRREMQETHFLPKLSLRPNESLFDNCSEDCMDHEDCDEDFCNEYDSYSEFPDNHCHGHDHQHHHHDAGLAPNNFDCNQQCYFVDEHHHNSREEQPSSSGDCKTPQQQLAQHGQDAVLPLTYQTCHDNENSITECLKPYNKNDHHIIIESMQGPNWDGASADLLQRLERQLSLEAGKISMPLIYDRYDFENTICIDEEYQTRQVNLFEIVERFTEFRSPREFPHWACIIMRNFVRKDEGGIRQCANFACGKWEEYPRQFAKCRRCKRTKYCSKACQLKAWSMHRYWCAPSPSTSQSAQSTTQLATAAGREAGAESHATSNAPSNPSGEVTRNAVSGQPVAARVGLTAGTSNLWSLHPVPQTHVNLPQSNNVTFAD